MKLMALISGFISISSTANASPNIVSENGVFLMLEPTARYAEKL